MRRWRLDHYEGMTMWTPWKPKQYRYYCSYFGDSKTGYAVGRVELTANKKFSAETVEDFEKAIMDKTKNSNVVILNIIRL